ncbi:MAG TPA: response regulator transcription factor [Ktedonobacteraceae bacterium]|nr:response regulator transcription factor [Ktedonobacteraceae bacterium]
MTRVFVIAMTPLGQAGLRSLLTTADLQVIGTSANPNAFGLEAEGADVLVVADDLLLPEIGRALTNPQAIAIVLLTNNSERYIPELQRLGLLGWGLVPIDASASQLQATVLAAAQGLASLPASLAVRFGRQPAMLASSALAETDESLTAREREVLELVSQGLSNKLIARQLQISEHTVKFHISSIATKLGATSRTDSVRLGLRRGLITL